MQVTKHDEFRDGAMGYSDGSGAVCGFTPGANDTERTRRWLHGVDGEAGEVF